MTSDRAGGPASGTRAVTAPAPAAAERDERPADASGARGNPATITGRTDGRGEGNGGAATPVSDSPLGGFEFRPHNCFACGQLNANGLQLDLHLQSGRCWTELALADRFEGWEGVVHGGILCTILDEVMAWSLVEQDNWGVTARMSVEFRSPVTVGAPIRAEGWITETRRRIQHTAGRIVDAGTGRELATATAVYVAADAAKKQELKRRYSYREERIQAMRGRREESAGGEDGAKPEQPR